MDLISFATTWDLPCPTVNDLSRYIWWRALAIVFRKSMSALHSLFSKDYLPLLTYVRSQGDGYLAFVPAGVTTTLLTNLDEESHAKYKRPVASAYSLSALKFYEPNVDRVISELLNALSEKATKNEVINLSRWCHYCRSSQSVRLCIGRFRWWRDKA
jgi:hypothetical protein